MNLGERIKAEIDHSGLDYAFIAAELEMSVQNLYKIFKKNSCETKYLVSLCRMLNKPITVFFEDIELPKQERAAFVDDNNLAEGTSNIDNDLSTDRVMQASLKQVVTKQNVDTKFLKLTTGLMMCNEKVKALEKRIADKDEIISHQKEIIELLRNRQ
jgi:hypothetical protein